MRELNFGDVYKSVKFEENVKAIGLLPEVLRQAMNITVPKCDNGDACDLYAIAFSRMTPLSVSTDCGWPYTLSICKTIRAS